MSAKNAEHKPTEEQHQLVKSLSGYGVPQEDICHILDISKPTLHKYYRRDIDVGMASANAKVGESLFKQATSGNMSAAIFWMKARAGWSEKLLHEHSGQFTMLFDSDDRDA
ncbi:MAG: hypothetical protein GY807_21025 [Gammaproteobacteria bacterium]|nr:hypothetical protein [Gammaproteobacteria bacterium]